MSAAVVNQQPRRHPFRNATLATGFVALAVGCALAGGIAGETSLRLSFDQAFTSRFDHARAHDPRLTAGFDVAAVRLGRHDGGSAASLERTAIHSGGPTQGGLGVLDAIAHTPRIGERIMVTAADGRIDALEVVATAPLPSGFDGRTGTAEPDGQAVNPTFDRAYASASSLLLVTLKPVGAEGETANRLVRMILDVTPTPPVAQTAVASRAKAL